MNFIIKQPGEKKRKQAFSVQHEDDLKLKVNVVFLAFFFFPLRGGD